MEFASKNGGVDALKKILTNLQFQKKILAAKNRKLLETDLIEPLQRGNEMGWEDIDRRTSRKKTEDIMGTPSNKH